MEGLNMSFRH